MKLMNLMSKSLSRTLSSLVTVQNITRDTGSGRLNKVHGMSSLNIAWILQYSVTIVELQNTFSLRLTPRHRNTTQ